MTKKRSLSYEQLHRRNKEQIEKLAESGSLNKATLARIEHIARFFARLGSSGPIQDLKFGDLTVEELREMFLATASPDADVGVRPTIQ